MLKKLFKSPKKTQEDLQTLESEMNEYVKENLNNKNRIEIDSFMNDEHKILYEIGNDEEIKYIIRQTSDTYNYRYQAPEVKKYLSTIICKCLFLQKKKIKPEHRLSYIY